MIWYLLYPLRGTTEIPVLPPGHPFRNAFARYGRYVARHVVYVLLISVAVATSLVYPFPFLYTTDFTNGASNLPHHVWTDAQPLGDRSAAKPDVIMRSIWVHGSYMKALERDVLLGALDLQDQLLGTTVNFSPRRARVSRPPDEIHGDLSPEMRDSFHVVNGLTNSSWFFHSPLLYWSCSSENILQDADILATVNEKKTQRTSVKVVLRHSIVFSGKRFQDRRLTAADALVITLIHMADSPVGEQWVRKAQALATEAADKWTIIPADGVSTQSQLYEFQFRPLSFQDKTVLTLAYLITLLYFAISLSKLRHVKSKFGGFLTLLTQIIVSMISSFTVCAIFKIDLSRIPYFAYPLVILAISMENSFRLMNSVLSMPSDQGISARIGYGFGETAHVAVASRAQNLAVLWGLSRITYPGVSAFCTFAAIAIVFDFFYLSTFFLSVLSIDIQRLELSDALEKASSARQSRQFSRQHFRKRQTWIDAILQGKIALSTRVAGTVVIFGFVLIAQWHFFNNSQSFGWPIATSWKNPENATAGASLLVDIHQARSPTSWLRLQDHETAREVIKVIKPDAHSYVARVHHPLVFVLKGSDRMPQTRERVFLPALYDFFNHQSLPFGVTVLVIVAAVRLLMNYLLWDELAASRDHDDLDDEPLLSIKCLDGGHALDIVMMTSTGDGRLVTVGLDRLICVWNVRTGSSRFLAVPPKNISEALFPILAMAVDRESHYLAICSLSRVFVWDLSAERWIASMPIDLFGRTPRAIFVKSKKENGEASVMVVRRNGTMAELRTGSAQGTDYIICDSPLLSAQPTIQKESRGRYGTTPSIVAASRNSCVHLVNQQRGEWVSEQLKSPGLDGQGILSILAIPALSVLLVVRTYTVTLVDIASSQILRTFPTERIQARSVKHIAATRRVTHSSGSTGLASLTLAYINADTSECVLHTYLPPEEGDVLCLCPRPHPAVHPCCSWDDAVELKRSVADPGLWELLGPDGVVGIRKTRARKERYYPGVGSILASSGLRRRGSGTQMNPDSSNSFEVWMIPQLDKQQETPEAEVEAQPLEKTDGAGGGGSSSSHLLISQLGPMVKIGQRSVAVALGNVVKVITLGQERFDTAADDNPSENLLNLSNRRRRTAFPRGNVLSSGQ